jgi:Holliday junction resolvase-like predicted endonuclease
VLVFVEVRLRRGGAPGAALESVARLKRDRLRRLANEYRVAGHDVPDELRIDVVALTLDSSGRLRDITVVENAVEDV